jgi:alpha-glucosidase
VFARKKNQEWWIGGITGDSARVLKLRPVPIDEDGAAAQWKLTLYQDDLNLPFNPNGVQVRIMKADRNTLLEIPMASGGGFAIKLQKQ